MMTKSTVRPALDVNRKVLGSGMVLLCVGGVLWLTGLCYPLPRWLKLPRSGSIYWRSLQPRWPTGECSS